MEFTRTFRVSGVAVLVGLLLRTIESLVPGGSSTLEGFASLVLALAGPVFFFSALRWFVRKLLWRVGTRLLLSYLLVGVVPVALVACLAFVGLLLVTGQLAARRVERAFAETQEALAAVASDLSATRLPRAAGPRTERFRRAAAENEEALPGLGIAWQPAGGGAVEHVGESAAGLLPAGWIEEGSSRSVLASLEDRSFLAAIESDDEGTLVLALPLSADLRRSLERATGTVLRMDDQTVRVEHDASGRPVGVSLGDADGGRRAAKRTPTPTPDPNAERGLKFRIGGRTDPLVGETAAPAAGSGPVSGRWVSFPVTIPQPVLDWKSGKPRDGRQVLALVRSSLSLEYGKLFEGSRIGEKEGGFSSRDIALTILRVLGLLTAGVYAGAALVAALLVVRVARATKRLSRGFAEVERGNFAHRARLGGRDQLSRLVGSFNEMASHLETAVAARASRDALDAELRVARDLQQRLLPPAAVTLPGVRIAADFRPAAAVGGDFWHVHEAPDGSLSVAVADVSGHGLPTGIVMAAAKASLSALLATGSPAERVFDALDQELRRTTDSRTFVTLAFVLFSPDRSRVSFTNAGHVYPYRVTADGSVSSLENPSRPLGVGLPGGFRTVASEAAPGDLWILLSDGVVEAPGAEDEPFGFGRLETALAACAGTSPEETKRRILDALAAFSGSPEPDDDRTLIVVGLEAADQNRRNSDADA